MRSLLCLLVLTCALTAQPAAVEQGGRPGGGPGGGTGGAGGAGQGALVGQSGGPGGNLPGPLRPAQRLMREGKVDEAMKLYQEYLAANPQSVPALNALGSALDVMGKSGQAKPYFQRAIDARRHARGQGASAAGDGHVLRVR